MEPFTPQNGNFTFGFSLLIKDNPSLNDRQEAFIFNDNPIGEVGEMNCVKVGTIMIMSFFLDDFGKDVVIFDITKNLGKDIHCAFTFKSGKVDQVFLFNRSKQKEMEVKFIRCPK